MNVLQENKKFILFIFIAIIGTVFLMQEKHYDDTFYKTYVLKTNKDMQEFELSEQLKGIAYSYVQDKKIEPSYRNTFYDCLGYSIYNSSPESAFQTTLESCKDDYIKLGKKAIYYNQAWLMRDFSRWDGSYILLERVIKKHIKQKESYTMKSTTSKMVFDDIRPHMLVSIEYRAANLGGRMYDKMMSVKVDAKTKELFDLK